MSTLIITSGNGKSFTQLKNFVLSLRTNGKYVGKIAICDNAISGTWNAPGTWSEDESFSQDQKQFFEEMEVVLYPIQQLLQQNDIDPEVIKSIKSPTQRYPYKFVYNTLISKIYINKVDRIFYFDSDIYFQAEFNLIEKAAETGKILIVKEFLRMKDGPYLNKWLNYSDFSKLSSQEDYLNTMLPAQNYCSGFYGSEAATFHRFNLLAMLLTSNKFVNFYSDQPLVNILKTFFFYPFKELDYSYCLHLGELDREQYTVEQGKFCYKSIIPICIHFNSSKYDQLEHILSKGYELPYTKPSLLQRLKRIARKLLRK
ncbi:hypothetical protein [Desertivirga xinjiangensis]|uniref:hypothetical protein n=1 Tax=Desertivirga xinjiangensis TaxID=539206 RepID=UPI00210E75B2|nr:hypothetical protein [Pedobacter xinjiangensis]